MTIENLLVPQFNKLLVGNLLGFPLNKLPMRFHTVKFQIVKPEINSREIVSK